MKAVKPYSEGQEKFGMALIKTIGRWQVAVYEWSGGRLWNTFLGGPVAILTTTGRKSGEPRKTPLLYLRWEDKVVMVGSKGGMPKPPLWLRNVEANPAVSIQIGSEKRDYRARIANAEEEVLLWPRLEAMYPGYIEYKARLAGIRHVPVIIFEPA